mmetsp:Transcript_28443/g.42990  ORF Transcript_28443/g.42990 Transcript_28443/m.42990 type:complete len:265 (-) Transcript_28443:64-858(-)|eukprot:CAMPEP_0178914934 /NCGR_PEP_ID=MMETSP0786-20121207/11723_1 /TAXON_ID=186022 /ORGANISM="Thalassionema frauenfeldii, Strain CCMP 1798" /LENGTH=264 /DNA_ID=CAMNT_0020587941 /DNA_START=240 /DNA_END=1037 /DNA_ORIENTATION=-
MADNEGREDASSSHCNDSEQFTYFFGSNLDAFKSSQEMVMTEPAFANNFEDTNVRTVREDGGDSWLRQLIPQTSSGSLLLPANPRDVSTANRCNAHHVAEIGGHFQLSNEDWVLQRRNQDDRLRSRIRRHYEEGRNQIIYWESIFPPDTQYEIDDVSSLLQSADSLRPRHLPRTSRRNLRHYSRKLSEISSNITSFPRVFIRSGGNERERAPRNPNDNHVNERNDDRRNRRERTFREMIYNENNEWDDETALETDCDSDSCDCL